MKSRVKLNTLDSFYIKYDISRIQFILATIKIINSILFWIIIYNVLTIVGYNEIWILVFGLIFNLIKLIGFGIQRARSIGNFLSLLLFPVLFIAPGKYKYNYDYDYPSILLITIYRLVKLVILVLLIFFSLSIIQMKNPENLPEYVQCEIQSLITDKVFLDKNNTEYLLTNGDVQVTYCGDLIVSSLSINNVLVLEYKDKYIQIEIMNADTNEFDAGLKGKLFVKDNIKLKFYNANKKEIKMIIKDMVYD